MEYGKNTVCILYRIKTGKDKAKLNVTPIINFRDFHAETYNHEFKVKQEESNKKLKVILDDNSSTPIYINVSDGEYIPHHNDSFKNMFYIEEEKRGFCAQENHANGSYLSRLYKNKTGHNLFDVINKMKLEKAKEYMRQGLRIYEVAQKVGFEDVSYFSRVFRKQEGCSPREYEYKLREEKRIQNEENK